MSIRRKQDLCLDAIEHSFSMARIAYERVVHYCRQQHEDTTTPHLDDAMVLDAWSFVDVVKRLRSVLQNTPGLKQRAQALTDFLVETETIPDFRNHVQHIEDKTAAVADTGRPIWGSFSWVTLDSNGKNFKICLYVPGRIAKTKAIPVVNPAGRQFHDDVDHFEMTIGATTINVSDMSCRIEAFRQRFEAAVKAALPKPIGPGETIMVIDLDSVPP
ncbi:MAG: hypothetical protein ACR2GW_10515 [Pyrinomonadaceae bacterium]|jgi:hypothetical protein